MAKYLAIFALVEGPDEMTADELCKAVKLESKDPTSQPFMVVRVCTEDDEEAMRHMGKAVDAWMAEDGYR